MDLVNIKGNGECVCDFFVLWVPLHDERTHVIVSENYGIRPSDKGMPI